MSDEYLTSQCTLMKKAIEEGKIRVTQQDIDNKGLCIVAEIHTREEKDEWTLIKCCPFCGEKLGNWLGDNTKCVTTKNESPVDEGDYEEDPCDDDYPEGDDSED